jgi:hypothetical protein
MNGRERLILAINPKEAKRIPSGFGGTCVATLVAI